MVDRSLPTLALWLFLLMVLPQSAVAHRLQVFAAADGAEIAGEAYFAGGAPAAGIEVLIEDGAGERLAALRSGPDGAFRYRAAAPVDHVVVARSGDGHRAQWRIAADELAPGFGTRAGAPSTHRDAPLDRRGDDAAHRSSTAAVASKASARTELEPALVAAVEAAVARQVRPLRAALEEARGQAALRDVLGGIGYIVGLAGLLIWWRGRKEGPRR